MTAMGARPAEQPAGGAFDQGAFVSAPLQGLPKSPFRGIEPFRFVDRQIFFAREDETSKLLRYVTIYRGVLLYGDSGSGKSSMINAGLIPAALEEDFAPELLRVQPSRAAAVKVERIAIAEEGPGRYLPTIFADDQEAARVFLSVEDFRDRIRRLPPGRRPLLIFDQFEELFTLFEAASTGDALSEARSTQGALFEALVDLLRDQSLPIKLLFVFREDFLAKLTRFFRLCPDLPDQYLHLTPPRIEKLSRIIRGPFEKFPGQFGAELPASLVDKLVTAFRERNQSGSLSLSEVQIVCQRLWQSADRDDLLTQKGIQGLLEDYLSEAVTRLSADVRDAALLVLTRMVTGAGTRNVVSEYDLINEISEHERVPDALVRRALEALERDARLIRREPRHDVYFYEIVSEFLVPWILPQKNAREAERRLREERAAAQARLARERLRTRRLGGGLAVSVFAVVILAVLSLGFLRMKQDADRAQSEAQAQEKIAHGHQLAREATARAGDRLDLALLLGLEVGQRLDQVEARKVLVGAFANGPNISAFLREHTGQVSGLAFSPDGKTLASSGFDGAVYLWQAGSGELARPPLRERGAGVAAVYNVRFSPDGNALAAPCDDGTVLLWDLRTGDATAVPPLKGHEGTVYDVAFSRDGKRLASAGNDGKVIVWDVALRQPIRVLPGHNGGAFAVAFGRDSTTLASGGRDSSLIVWDTTSGNVRARLDGLPARVFTLAISPDGSTLAAGYADGGVEVRRLAGLQSNRQLPKAHTSEVDRVAFSPDGQKLASGSRDRSVIVWDLKTGKQADYSLTGYRSEVYGLAFAPSGTVLASGSGDGTIVLWNLPLPSTEGSTRAERRGPSMQAGSLTQILAYAPSRVQSLAFDPNGRALMAGTSNGVTQWDTATGDPKRIGRMSTWVMSVAQSANGAMLAAAGCAVRGATPGSCSAGEIQMLNAASGEPLRDPIKGHTNWVASLAFSRDGKVLASGGWDGEVMFWDASTGQPQGAPLKVGTRVNVLAFSPDNRLLAAGTEDDVVVWDAVTRERRKSLSQEHEQERETQVNAVVFNPKPENDDLLAIGGSSSDVLLWDFGTNLVRRLDKHRAPVTTLAFSPDGTILASGSFDYDVILWDVASGEPGVPLTGSSNPVTSLAFDPTGNRLASAGSEGPLMVWDIGYDSLRRRACQVAGRNLTRDEWDRFLRDEPQQISCGHALVRNANRYATLGQPAAAEASFTEAIRAANSDRDHQLANSICWSGSLNGFAKVVMPACERAVALAPPVEIGLDLDSRGVARAITGDITGAIADFKAYLAWAGGQETFAPYRQKRQAWIEALQKGENPFDAATLRSLKTE